MIVGAGFPPPRALPGGYRFFTAISLLAAPVVGSSTEPTGAVVLVITWLVGSRDGKAANVFMADVAARLRSRVQLTTDGHNVYLDAVENAFGCDIDYATLIKLYGQPQESERRYSPAPCGCRT